MSGRVVQSPPVEHHCNPGVTHAVAGPDSDIAGLTYAVLPDRYRYPPGSVWECECGRTYIAYRPWGADETGQIGRIRWRREGRWARRRRVRRAKGD